MKKLVAAVIIVSALILLVSVFTPYLRPRFEEQREVGNEPIADDRPTVTHTDPDFTLQHSPDFTVESQADIPWSRLSPPSVAGETYTVLTLPHSFASSTNFSEASISVGGSPKLDTCLKPEYALSAGTKVEINGIPMMRVTASDAGAGNRYEYVSYRFRHRERCFALEYALHYTVVENYDPALGITEFDRRAVIGLLENAVNTFKLR